MNRAKWCFAGLAAGLAWVVPPALGDVTGIFNDLVGGKSAPEAFIGTWSGPAGSDIDHIVVSAASSGPVRIQVFGRCEARVCNWGALPARIRTDGPSSEAIRSLSADFNLGFALRHITLHRSPGNALRFDMVTEFTDGSDRHDYETAGQLVPAGAPVAAVPQAAPAPVAPAPVAQSPAAQTPVAQAPAPVPQVASPPPPASGAGGGITALNPLSWFSSSKPAPAAQPGQVPEDNSTAVAASAAMPVDDCIPVDTGHVYIASAGGNWNVRDFLHVVQSFGPYKAAANKGMAVIKYYRFDEVCHVRRGSSNLSIFRAAGEVPHQAMTGEECNDVHPDRIVAVNKNDDWKVMDGDRELFNYGSDRDGAVRAAGVIKSLALSRQCFFDRAEPSASYWLSR